MAEGVDGVEGVLITEIAPTSKPRDTAGKYVRETTRPEPMFSDREIEGDPLTGDTSDAGDDPVLRAREREISDGYERDGEASPKEKRPRDESSRSRSKRDGHSDADDGYDLPDGEPENISAESESDALEAQDSQDEDGDDSDRYEVTIDGQKQEVSLREALDGYIRTETFHQRMDQVRSAARELEQQQQQLAQGWSIWNQARAEYEEDLANLVPREPNWDEEFAKDPRAAHAQQKVFQIIYGKLAQSRQLRADRNAYEAQEADRRLEKYAVDGFSKFVMDHIKVMPDEVTLKKNISSMRRTASAAGFSDLEVATVYDPRMLDILWKASKYDRMKAGSPKPVVTGKGSSLPPGKLAVPGGT